MFHVNIGEETIGIGNVAHTTLAKIQEFYFVGYMVSIVIQKLTNFWARVVCVGKALNCLVDFRRLDAIKPIYNQVQAELTLVLGMAPPVTSLIVSDEQTPNIQTDLVVRQLEKQIIMAKGEESRRIMLEKKSIKKKTSKEKVLAVAAPVTKHARSMSVSAVMPTTELSPRVESRSIMENAQVSRTNSLKTSRANNNMFQERPRSDRPTPIEVPDRGEVTESTASGDTIINRSIKLTAEIDHFARYCWQQFEQGAYPSEGGVNALLENYTSPENTRVTMTNEAQMEVILSELPVDIQRSQVINDAVRQLKNEMKLAFDAQIEVLLSTKYQRQDGGFKALATDEDYLRGQKLCVIINFIAGLRVRYAKLEKMLLEQSEMTTGNPELAMYTRTCEILVTMQNQQLRCLSPPSELAKSSSNGSIRRNSVWRSSTSAGELPSMKQDGSQL
jgi:hypothetical protein